MKNTVAAAVTYFMMFSLYAIFTFCEILELRSHLIGEAKLGMVLFTGIGFLLLTIFFCIALTFKLERRTRWFAVGSFLAAVLLLIAFVKSLAYNATLVIYPP